MLLCLTALALVGATPGKEAGGRARRYGPTKQDHQIQQTSTSVATPIAAEHMPGSLTDELNTAWQMVTRVRIAAKDAMDAASEAADAVQAAMDVQARNMLSALAPNASKRASTGTKSRITCQASAPADNESATCAMARAYSEELTQSNHRCGLETRGMVASLFPDAASAALRTQLRLDKTVLITGDSVNVQLAHILFHHLGAGSRPRTASYVGQPRVERLATGTRGRVIGTVLYPAQGQGAVIFWHGNLFDRFLTSLILQGRREKSFVWDPERVDEALLRRHVGLFTRTNSTWEEIYHYSGSPHLLSLLTNGTMFGRRLDAAVVQFPRDLACSTPMQTQQAELYAQRLLSGWTRLGVQPIWTTAPPSSLKIWQSTSTCNSLGRAAASKVGARVLDLAAHTLELLKANARRLGYQKELNEGQATKAVGLYSPKAKRQTLMGACAERLGEDGRCYSNLLMVDAVHWCEIAVSAWGEMLLSMLS
mmetsp:Transcript_6762/g.14785  ORF Transcript_6762/g.14785 Transcript_6762/m.14785 type:complete len:481 (-) Transcript_6762:21-1463(-)